MKKERCLKIVLFGILATFLYYLFIPLIVSFLAYMKFFMIIKIIDPLFWTTLIFFIGLWLWCNMKRRK